MVDNPDLTSREPGATEDSRATRVVDSVQEYALQRAFYVDYTSILESILRQSLERPRRVHVLDVQSRAKTVESFRNKAGRLSDDGVRLKYSSPLEQLTDLAGCRVIVFFPRTVQQVEEQLRVEFEVLEKVDHAANAVDEGRLGYLSVHFVVRLKEPRVALPEYARFEGAKAEVQVRTVMQHAWAEIEHDIQYKSAYSVPKELARRFATLAGLLEIADREFQNIQDRDQELRRTASQSVEAGNFSGVEVTPTAMKIYLDRRFGPDNRMSDWSYDQATRIVKNLGVATIEELDAAVRGLDDDQISRVVDGSRVGQVRRFEYVLLCAFPGIYAQKHPWSKYTWFHEQAQEWTQKLRAAHLLRESHASNEAMPSKQ